MNSNNQLTPALTTLLEACYVLKTKEAKIIAPHLHRSPATVRTEFQRVMSIMNVNCRYAALRTAEENGWLDVSSAKELNA